MSAVSPLRPRASVPTAVRDGPPGPIRAVVAEASRFEPSPAPPTPLPARAPPAVRAALKTLRQEFLRQESANPGSKLQAPTPAVREALRAVVAAMTLEEKAGQLSCHSNGTAFGPDQPLPMPYPELIASGGAGQVSAEWSAVAGNWVQRTAMTGSRLGLPVLSAGDIALHGFRTLFPVPIGMACTFDPALVRRTAEVAGKEAHAANLHLNFGPMCDMAPDPRWGRIIESCGGGEDPLLAARMARAYVEGLGRWIGTTAKHFVAYGAARAGRDYAGVDLPERELRETYLPPFQAALDAGATAVMAAFHAHNGVPVTANPELLVDTLRGRMGGDDVVVMSDHSAIKELVAHGVAQDERDAVRLALEAGVDVDLQSGLYGRHLPSLVRDGTVDARRVDAAVERMLLLKWKVGLFAHPLRDAALEASTAALPEHRALAYEAATKAVVMLKNGPDTPPLAGARRICVLGPADRPEDALGTRLMSARGRPDEAVSLLSGLVARAAKGGAQVVHAAGPGVGPRDPATAAVAVRQALEAARDADVVVAVVGEDGGMNGEAASRTDLGLSVAEQAMLEAVKATGKRLVVLLQSGRPLTVPWVKQHADDVYCVWHLGSEAGHAAAAILFGDVSPSGRLPVTFPLNLGQVPISYRERRNGRPPDAPNADAKFTSRYLDAPNAPAWPFGFGLGYGLSTRLSNARLDRDHAADGDTVTVSVDVTHDGTRAGDELLQLYASDEVAAVSPRGRELKDFQRVPLEPGETKTVRFRLPVSALAVLDRQLNPVVDPGFVRLTVGTHAENGVSVRLRMGEG